MLMLTPTIYYLTGDEKILVFVRFFYPWFLFQAVFRNYIDEKDPTPIKDDTYDVLICCAGFFQGLISPNAFIELIRITKPGKWVVSSLGENDYLRQQK